MLETFNFASNTQDSSRASQTRCQECRAECSCAVLCCSAHHAAYAWAGDGQSVRHSLHPEAHLMTWTWALITSVLLTVKPSSTLLSSMNFFQPQSCSFLQKRCRVSAEQPDQSLSCKCTSTAKGLRPFKLLLLSPEYLDFFGSLLTTAMVNCEKWFQPAKTALLSGLLLDVLRQSAMGQQAAWWPTWQELVVISDAQEQREVIADITPLRVHQDVPA